MKVAVIVNSFPVLSESFIFNKVLGLRKAGVNVTVYAHNKHNHLSYFIDRVSEQDLNFVTYSSFADGVFFLPLKLMFICLRHPKIACKLWADAVKLYRISSKAVKAWIRALPLQLGKFDIIHFAYSGLAVEYLDALPLLAPAKLVASCRGSADLIIPLTNKHRGENLCQLFPQLDRVHCVSKDMQQKMEHYGLLPEQAFINYPSINTTEYHRTRPYPINKNGPFKLITVGRLHRLKGLDFALLSVKYLLDEGYLLNYEIIGGGQEEDKLRFMIHDLRLEPNVCLRGAQAVSEVRQSLEEADIFLLPSLSEGLSNAVLEAMAMELPVVSTYVGGMPEAITDSVDGFLVAPYNPALMADRIKLLLENADMRISFGKAARAKIETEFNLDLQISRFVQEYRALSSK